MQTVQTTHRIQRIFIPPISRNISENDTQSTRCRAEAKLEEDSDFSQSEERSVISEKAEESFVSSPERHFRFSDHRPFRHRASSLSSDRSDSWTVQNEKPVEWAFMDENLPKFPTETKELRVLVVTWNLYGKKPKDGIEALLNTNRIKHHIISIGTEECLRSIPASTLYDSKSRWINLLRKHLDRDYVMLKSHAMNALHLTVFVHKSILHYISGIESNEVRTGFKNLMGNKGGIGISMKVAGSSFLFINCHLASGQKHTKHRNQDFERIINELELPEARVTEEKRMKQRSTIIDRFDFIFWSGDFNYRVNQSRDNTIRFLKENKMSVVLKQDQLSIEMQYNKLMRGFHEGQIKFPPTYKYQVDSHAFDNKKMRTPSWTDRILYKEDGGAKIEQKTYQSIHSVTTSDHRPVFSQFEVKLPEDGQQIGPDGLIKMKSGTCNMF